MDSGHYMVSDSTVLPELKMEWLFKCGAGDCGYCCLTLLELHIHLQLHVATGSYHFDNVIRTAFPKNDSADCATQTCNFESDNDQTSMKVVKPVMMCSSTQTDSSEVPTDSFLLHNNSLPLVKIETLDPGHPGTDACYSNDIKHKVTWTTDKKLRQGECYSIAENNSRKVNKKRKQEKKKQIKGTKRSKVCESITDETLYDDDTDIEYEYDTGSYIKNIVSNNQITQCTVDDTTSLASKLDPETGNVIKDEDTVDKIKTNPYSRTAKTLFRKYEKASSQNKHKTAFVKRASRAKALVCKFCSKILQGSRRLRKHYLDEHPLEKNFQCSKCTDASFVTEKELIIHKREHFHCQICNCNFSRSQAFKDHMSIHDGIKLHKCDICGAEFRTNNSKFLHMARMHSDKRDIMCEICGKLFKCSDDLRSHSIYCQDIRPFDCDVCHMKFARKKTLTNHYRKHTGEQPYVCEVCGQKFRHASSLTAHRSIHTGERPYKCDVCALSFRRPNNLKNHLKVHQQDKQYHCRYCSKSFITKTNLETHERQHTGETPFVCHLCGLGFKQRVLLKRHMQHHLGQLSPEEMAKYQSTSTPLLNKAIVTK